jgi:predicted O-linked N-acetylglucosamine transferase (SPINDLY family)
VPHFYWAFFGTNNVDMYRDMARVLLKSDALKPDTDATRLSYVSPFVAELKRKGLHRVANRKRIKVGFSSMFFREHASGRMIQGVIDALSRDLFEVRHASDMKLQRFIE